MSFSSFPIKTQFVCSNARKQDRHRKYAEIDVKNKLKQAFLKFTIIFINIKFLMQGNLRGCKRCKGIGANDHI